MGVNQNPLKYMLVFTNTIENEIDYFSKFDIGKDIKAIYVSVYIENSKKEIENEAIS